MKVFRYLAVLSILLLPAAYSHAQVSIGIGVGSYGPPVAYGPPACSYGYYGYAPYACAPYGYYGPDWFINGAFVGAGPWYHRYYYPRSYGYIAPRAYVGRPYVTPGYGRGYVNPGYLGRGGFGYRGHR